MNFVDFDLTVEFLDCAVNVGVLPSLATKVKNKVSDFHPDFIHFQEATSSLAIILSFVNWGVPVIMTVHDPIPHSGEDNFSFSSIKRRLVLNLWRAKVDAVVTHGQSLADIVDLIYPKLKGLVYSVPHGPLGGPPAIEPGQTGTFLFFGRIQVYKGLGNFVSAIRKLHDQGLPVRGVIAGRGEDLVRHWALIDGHPAFELHERYIPHDELPCLFGRAQAVVLPYIDGTQSGVGAMALGFGRAIIATRVGALQDMVRDGDNGLLVPPGDAGALAAAMARLMAAPDEAARMGKRSVELGQTDLSWQRNAQITLQAYEAAIRRKRGAG
jgi:glycosyltransferase involved in cell wall biosynthesis